MISPKTRNVNTSKAKPDLNWLVNWHSSARDRLAQTLSGTKPQRAIDGVATSESLDAEPVTRLVAERWLQNEQVMQLDSNCEAA